jgi:hypothetical protein
MNKYTSTTWAFKFEREELHFDFSTNAFVYLPGKAKRSFAGVGPVKALRMLVKSETEKGHKITKITAMYSRNSKMEWTTHAEH